MIPAGQNHEIYERLSALESGVKNIERWDEKYYQAMQSMTREIHELKQEFAVWRDRQSLSLRAALAFTGLAAGLVVALANWLLARM